MSVARLDVPCDLCGATDVDEIFPPHAHAHAVPAEIFMASAEAPLTDRLVRCRRCGLVFVSPRLPDDVIAGAYGHSDDPRYVERGAGRRRTFEHLLTVLTPYTPRPGALFDVGAATGEFLAVARQRGWTGDGCEPNQRLVDVARERHGVVIRHGAIETIGGLGSCCDLVTLWDVLEHMPSPAATLTLVASMLRPGGIVAATFPDFGSLSSRVLRRGWPLLSAVHLYYFTRHTAAALFENAGFEVVTVRAHRPRVELGHALVRAAQLGGTPARLLRAASSVLHLDHVVLPFQFGQSLIVARLLN